MDHGATWGYVECGHLAIVWLAFSQDPILKMERPSSTFLKKLPQQFCKMKLADVCKKRNNARGLESCRSKFEAVAADIQKLQIIRREVRSYNRTGKKADLNLSMAIARQVQKVGTIAYEAKSLPHNKWINHLARKKLRELQKFNEGLAEFLYWYSQHSMRSQINRFPSAEDDKMDKDDVNDSSVHEGNEQTTISTPLKMHRPQNKRRHNRQHQQIVLGRR